MKFQHMFKRTAKRTVQSLKKTEVPKGLLRKCNECRSAVFAEEVKENYYICPHCRNYFRIHARRRVEMLADEGSFEEWDGQVVSGNPLGFRGYEEKIALLQDKTGLSEAVLTGKICIKGMPAVIGVCDGRFLMASMGEAVGEKITRAVERAAEERLPVILYACSGGARMQEGIVSLMQMAKTAAAIKRHSDAGLLYISVLTDPTMGGVTASFAMLGDIILAEPNALIGFAGPRVIEQTIGQKLPKGFQRAEFLLEHGFIDEIVERKEQRDTLARLLKMHQMPFETADTDFGDALPIECPFSQMDAWEHVQLARAKDRPGGRDYISRIFTDFFEMHGDRCFGDDRAVTGGIALFEGVPVTVIAQEKGHGTKENMLHNFGMASPEGYRKALRLMKQAEKFARPVICFVDTPGAFCGMEAEERGQGAAIARNLYEMSALKVPILSIVIGEGGSGGALALAAADEVWMMEHAVYSVLSPEGFASILWKDSKRAKEAAGVMKLTALDLKKLGVIERIISEEDGFSEKNMEKTVNTLRLRFREFLKKYLPMEKESLTSRRYQRFRMM